MILIRTQRTELDNDNESLFVGGMPVQLDPSHDVGCMVGSGLLVHTNAAVIFFPIRGKVPRLWLDHDRGLIW
jgi:hypothetical protein